MFGFKKPNTEPTQPTVDLAPFDPEARRQGKVLKGLAAAADMGVLVMPRDVSLALSQDPDSVTFNPIENGTGVQATDATSGVTYVIPTLK